MSAERVLIDTSVWIDYFRNKTPHLSEKVDKILAMDEVFVPKIVIAELIQGAKSEKEISVIEDFFNAFHIIDQEDGTWLNAGRLAYNLKKKGKPLNLTDCYISVISQENKCKIFTLDKHFKDIQKTINIQLIPTEW